MNYLLSYGPAGMGDFIATIMFLRDFEEQCPNDTLYLKFEIPFMEKKYSELLLNNPYWHSYDESKQIDKTIHFGWGESINDVEKVKLNEDCPYVYTDVIYQAFNSRAGTNIVKSRPKADIFFSDDELQPIIQSEKPICVINIGYNIFHGNSRNWGWSKFQHIVNSLKDKVEFIQVGSNQQGYYHFPLSNVTNMLDKTPSVRQVLRLLRQARFVITHNSSLLHLAAFDSDIKRTVYCVIGGKDYYNFFDCYDAKNVELAFVKNNQFFSKMFNLRGCHNPNEYCCDAGIVFKTGLPSVGNAKICKQPTYDEYGNVLCRCYHALNPNIVINSINKHLDEFDKVQTEDHNKHIDIGTACTKNHLIHVIEMINTLKSHCTSNITVHAIVDCTDDEVNDIQGKVNFINNENVKIIIYPSTRFESKLEMKNINLKQSKMTYARLYSNTFIDESIDRLLWIETDVLIRQPGFDEMFDLPFDDNYAIAIEDPSVELFAKSEMNNCKTERYLNGGIILFNLKKMREDNMFSKFDEFIHNPPAWFLKNNIFDQTILNYFFAGKIKFIGMKFNVQTAMFAYPHYDIYAQKEGYLDQHDLFKHCIVSHMMQVKPWDDNYAKHQPYQYVHKKWQKKLYEDNVKDCIQKYGPDYEFLTSFK